MRDMRAEYIQQQLDAAWRAAMLPELIADGILLAAIVCVIAFLWGVLA